jgi:hypothetical protein
MSHYTVFRFTTTLDMALKIPVKKKTVALCQGWTITIQFLPAVKTLLDHYKDQLVNDDV